MSEGDLYPKSPACKLKPFSPGQRLMACSISIRVLQIGDFYFGEIDTFIHNDDYTGVFIILTAIIEERAVYKQVSYNFKVISISSSCIFQFYRDMFYRLKVGLFIINQ